jgi:hypothetical protein
MRKEKHDTMEELNNINGGIDESALSILATTSDCFFLEFLQSVVHGNQDHAEKALKTQPNLLLKKGKITDGAGRMFASISSFQYALWALDAHMWVMMLKCVPQEELGVRIKIELLKQFEEVERQGLTDELNEQVINKNHFDFSPLLSALQLYIDFYDKWSLEERKYHWCVNVGGIQKWDGTNDGPPSHVLDEIFRMDRSFYPSCFITQRSLLGSE